MRLKSAILLLLIAQAFICHAQSDTKLLTLFCNPGDTVSFKDLVICHKLSTGLGDNVIMSFQITIVHDGVLSEYTQNGNEISQSVMDEIGKWKPSKIFIENVMVQYFEFSLVSSPVTVAMTY